MRRETRFPSHPRRGRMENKLPNDQESHDWISTPALLVALPAHHALCADSQNDSLAGFSLLKTS